MMLVFVYLLQFDRQNGGLLSDSDMRQVEFHLCRVPRYGEMIPGSGGAYKLRVGVAGRGARGGARLVYYYAPAMHRIYFIGIYAKNRQKDLTPQEIKEVQSIVRALKEERR